MENVAARLVTLLRSDGFAEVNITALPVLSEGCLRESNPLSNPLVDLSVARFTWEGARVHGIDNNEQLVAGYFSELSFSNDMRSEFWTTNYFARPSLAFMVASFDKVHVLNASGSSRLDATQLCRGIQSKCYNGHKRSKCYLQKCSYDCQTS